MFSFNCKETFSIDFIYDYFKTKRIFLFAQSYYYKYILTKVG